MARLLCSLILFFLGASSWAQTVQIAVAANFAGAIKPLATEFERTTGYKTAISSGATGKFYAQIGNGAPFDVFLSADQTTPTQLVKDQLAVPATQFTYAVGKLVLWSAIPGLVDAKGAVLKSARFAHLAIASPQLAPYGAVAVETLKSMNLIESLTPKFVQGESIGQTYTFVATGNAELGFVALSQVWSNGQIQPGSAWIVPQNLYTPLRQDAVLLKHGENNPAAAALLIYLKSAAAKKIIQDYGYD